MPRHLQHIYVYNQVTSGSTPHQDYVTSVVRLAVLFNTAPEFLMNLQKTYELRLAGKALSVKVRRQTVLCPPERGRSGSYAKRGSKQYGRNSLSGADVRHWARWNAGISPYGYGILEVAGGVCT